MRFFLRLLAVLWVCLFGLLLFTSPMSNSFSSPSGQGLLPLLIPLYALLMISCLGLLFFSNWARRTLGVGLLIVFLINLAGTMSLLRGKPLFPAGELWVSTLNWFAEFIGLHWPVPLFFPELLMGVSAVILFLPAARAVTQRQTSPQPRPL